MSYVIAGGVLIWFVAVVWCCVAMLRAPYGYEDDDGYHDGLEPGERLP